MPQPGRLYLGPSEKLAGQNFLTSAKKNDETLIAPGTLRVGRRTESGAMTEPARKEAARSKVSCTGHERFVHLNDFILYLECVLIW